MAPLLKYDGADIEISKIAPLLEDGPNSTFEMLSRLETREKFDPGQKSAIHALLL